METQGFHGDGLVEGPSVAYVSLREHFLQDALAVPELLREAEPLARQGRLGQVLPGGLDGASAAPPGQQLAGSRALQGRRGLAAGDGRRGRRGRIRFSLDAGLDLRTNKQYIHIVKKDIK